MGGYGLWQLTPSVHLTTCPEQCQIDPNCIQTQDDWNNCNDTLYGVVLICLRYGLFNLIWLHLYDVWLFHLISTVNLKIAQKGGGRDCGIQGPRKYFLSGI